MLISEIEKLYTNTYLHNNHYFEAEFSRYCDSIESGDRSGNNKYNISYNRTALAYALKHNRVSSTKLLLEFLGVPTNLTLKEQISYYQLTKE